jgi:hypothetical protein
MSNNREKRQYAESVHIFMALQRMSKQGNKNCIRTVIKDEELDLKMLEAKVKVLGGEWRIHKTVNARNVETARKILLKRLIDNPEKGAYVDSEWRSALLQRECKETKYLMLDIDTQDEEKIKIIENLIPKEVELKCCIETIHLSNIRPERIELKQIPNKEPQYRYYRETILSRIKSPKGWHYITLPFDSREVCKLEDVSLIRDGYYYIKTVGIPR